MNDIAVNAVQVEDMSLSNIIEDAMRESIRFISSTLRYEFSDAQTHKVITILSWNDSVDMKKHIANYLVGLRACAIDAALNIRAALLDIDDEESRVDLFESICEIVGNDNSTLTDDFKEDNRKS